MSQTLQATLASINQTECIRIGVPYTGIELKRLFKIRPSECLYHDRGGEPDIEIANDGCYEFSAPPCFYLGGRGKLVVIIDKRPYALPNPCLTGAALKKLAGIDPGDQLYLDIKGGKDQPVRDDQEVCLCPGAKLFSQPPADYGNEEELHRLGVPPGAVVHPQGKGHHVVLPCVPTGEAFTEPAVDVLVKLPPGFPDASPDMFWVYPPLQLRSGGNPRNADQFEEQHGRRWQRFSWHLRPGAWRPGRSTFDDFLRAIHARFALGN